MKQGAATTSEGVLANFFNSLLSKKTGGLAGGQPGPVGAPPSVGAGAAGAKPAAGADDCEYFSLRLSGEVSAIFASAKVGGWWNLSPDFCQCEFNEPIPFTYLCCSKVTWFHGYMAARLLLWFYNVIFSMDSVNIAVFNTLLSRSTN